MTVSKYYTLALNIFHEAYVKISSPQKGEKLCHEKINLQNNSKSERLYETENIHKNKTALNFLWSVYICITKESTLKILFSQKTTNKKYNSQICFSLIKIYITFEDELIHKK